MKKIILTGDRPTGPLHIGHLEGSLKNRVKLQESGEYEIYIFAADVQALTDHFNDPETVRKNVHEVVCDYLACGIDPNKTTIFIQSQIPEVAELTVFYSNLVTMARLYRNPTVKTEIAQKKALFGENGEGVTYGFVGYPVSQAADITAFDSIYGQTLKEPEALVGEVSRLKGLDGNKMSKSLGNAIYLKDSEEEIMRKVSRATTDPNKIKKDDPANPEICNVFYYHKIYSKDNLDTICKECKNGTRGCVACKKELAKNINEYLKPIREKRKYYEERPELVQKILEEGTEKARKKALNTIKKVKKSMHINYFE